MGWHDRCLARFAAPAVHFHGPGSAVEVDNFN